MHRHRHLHLHAYIQNNWNQQLYEFLFNVVKAARYSFFTHFSIILITYPILVLTKYSNTWYKKVIMVGSWH
jgi:hypothetical protein